MKKLLSLLLCLFLAASPAFAITKTVIVKENGEFVQKVIELTPEEEYAELLREAATLARKAEKPLSERLNDAFMSQAPEVRAQFYPLKAAVQSALKDGDIEAAKAIIAGADVPAELEALKQQLLEMFP